MFFRCNKLEQLEFKFEKIIGIEKHAGKVRKDKFYHLYFLENARAYQIIKYHFKLNGENHVSAECIFYYTVVKLAND